MKFLKNFKKVLLIFVFLTNSLVARDFLPDADELSNLTKEELQEQAKIVAAQILSELNPDTFSKIKKHGIYGLCALISGLSVGIITWAYASDIYSDLKDSGVNACIAGSGVLAFLWSLVLLEILNTVVFDSIQTEKDKLWVLGKLNQILNDQGK